MCTIGFRPFMRKSKALNGCTEARIAVAHGQMNEDELERLCLVFMSMTMMFWCALPL